MPRSRVIELFKPAETEQEIENGGFRLLDNTKVPERPPNPSEEETSSDQGEDAASSNSEAEEFNDPRFGRIPTPSIAPRARRPIREVEHEAPSGRSPSPITAPPARRRKW
jgi:hypothetical protein